MGFDAGPKLVNLWYDNGGGGGELKACREQQWQLLNSRCDSDGNVSEYGMVAATVSIGTFWKASERRVGRGSVN
jgi:hypothetical protein